MNLISVPRQTVSPKYEGTSSCERRGYCGPFAHEDFYNAFPEALWHGMGDCLECGTTRKVADAGNGDERIAA